MWLQQLQRLRTEAAEGNQEGVTKLLSFIGDGEAGPVQVPPEEFDDDLEMDDIWAECAGADGPWDGDDAKLSQIKELMGDKTLKIARRLTEAAATRRAKARSQGAEATKEVRVRKAIGK